MEKNKIIIGLVMLVLISSGCIGGSQITATPNPTTTQAPTTKIQGEISKYFYLTYENPADGIRIKYPAGWVKEELQSPSRTLFYSPPESESDTFSEQVNILIDDRFTQPITLDEYEELILDQLKYFFTDYNIISTGETTLANNPALEMVYTATQEKSTAKILQVFTIKNNKVYVITFVSEPREYSDYFGTAQEMINSFEIT